MIGFINILLLMGLSYGGFRLLKSDLPMYIYWLALLMKLSAGIVLGLIFFHYYESGDTIHFFESAKNSIPIEKQPRTQFFIAFLKPFIWLTGESYWLTSLWISLIGFTAVWYSTLVFIRAYPQYRALILLSFLFTPSVVFWTSGIMKDTLAFAALIMLVSQAVSIYKSFKINIINLILILLSGWLLFKIKHYLLIDSLIFISVLSAIALFQRLKKSWKWMIPIAIITMAIISTQFVHPYLNINKLPWVLYKNNQAILDKSVSSNTINIEIEDDSWAAVVREIPDALHVGLFRPSIFDKTPFWGWIHKIENLVLTILMFMSIILYFKIKPPIDKPIFIAAIISIMVLAILLALSTPNFGSLVRYKSAYLPFLLLICSVSPFQYLTSKTND